MSRFVLTAGVAGFLAIRLNLSICPATAGDWPQWRGAGRAGVWQDVRLPHRLDENVIEEVWSASLGSGFSGVVVAGHRVLTMDRGKDRQEERVVCLSTKDASILWTHEYEALYGDLDWGKGPRSTPTVDGEEVFTVGAVGRVSCLRLVDGKRLWSLDLQEIFGGKQPQWGHSAAPLVTEEFVYLQAGGQPGGNRRGPGPPNRPGALAGPR